MKREETVGKVKKQKPLPLGMTRAPTFTQNANQVKQKLMLQVKLRHIAAITTTTRTRMVDGFTVVDKTQILDSLSR